MEGKFLLAQTRQFSAFILGVKLLYRIIFLVSSAELKARKFELKKHQEFLIF
jgi:hypothetical protein